jgi:hypothetical protein
VLRQVFDLYGIVEDMGIFDEGVETTVLVQYHSASDAATALKNLQGRNIYDGCCRLEYLTSAMLQFSMSRFITSSIQ